MVQVVINTCYGGFGLSDKAFERLAEKGMKISRCGSDPSAEIEELSPENQRFGSGKYYFSFNCPQDPHKIRTDPRLIEVVREIGAEANGECSELKIVDVPDDVKWHIEEYDGIEWVRENSRTWE